MKSRSGSSASSGRLMDKGDLLKLVYSDTIVEENAIAKNVSTLQKVLAGDLHDKFCQEGRRSSPFAPASGAPGFPA